MSKYSCICKGDLDGGGGGTGGAVGKAGGGQQGGGGARRDLGLRRYWRPGEADTEARLLKSVCVRTSLWTGRGGRVVEVSTESA